MSRKQANNEVQRQAQELLAGLAKRYGVSGPVAPVGTDEERLNALRKMSPREVYLLADRGDDAAKHLVRSGIASKIEGGKSSFTDRLVAAWSASVPEGHRIQVASYLAETAKQIRRNLAGTEPLASEAPIVEAATIAFVQLNFADLYGSTTEDLKAREFYSRAAERANRRFLSAVRTLATVRRLLRPDAPAVVVNLAQLAESVTNYLGLAKTEALGGTAIQPTETEPSEE